MVKQTFIHMLNMQKIDEAYILKNTYSSLSLIMFRCLRNFGTLTLGARVTAHINLKSISADQEHTEILRSLDDLLHDKVNIAKFKVIGYHCLPPIGADLSDPISFVGCLNYPKDRSEDYKERKLYRRNPFVMKPLLAARPLLWSDIFNSPDLTREDRYFIEKVRDRYKGNGISIPVFGPLGHNGNFSIQLDSETLECSNFDILALQMACQQSHIDICNLLNTKKPRSVHLTNRERDILEWVVTGKSSAAIASIMGISPHTVNGYFRNLFLKFNTTDRVSTVFRAIASGVIH